jgi:eukaryotic-like serine/threonine-protein kinase
MRDGSLWAVPFDLATQQINGSEVMLIEKIDSPPLTSTYTLSGKGDLIYLEGELVADGAPRSTLSWVDRSGVETPLEMEAMPFAAPELSPDGNRVALALLAQQSTDIWSYELARGTLSRITFSNNAHSPLWSPDGARIIYSTPAGPESINANGIGEVEKLASSLPSNLGTFFPTAITPDASDILTYVGGGNARAIYRLRQTPEQTTMTPLLNAPEYVETAAALSPDGRWLAYVTNETGQDEVYVRPYPDIDGGKWQISTNGGISPRWSSANGELFYRNPRGNLVETYAVAITNDEQFSAAIPELLFSSRHYALASNSYMVTADGQRFLMMRPATSSTATGAIVDTNLILVENFAEEVRRLVPADPI